MTKSQLGSKKSIVITGTSTGIGEDAAKFFAKKGWIVFAGVRKQSDADRLSSYDSNIKPLILDVTNQEQVDKAFEEVRVAVGTDGLYALVNNAGLGYMGPAEFFPLNKVQRQFDVNVFGVIRVTQAALPLLRIGSPGRIVNVSSIAADLSAPLLSMYSGTKGALDSISESMRRELAEWGIKVSVLKPGPVKTSFQDTAVAHTAEVQEAFPVGSRGDELYGKLLKNFPSAIEKSKKLGVADPSASSSVIYKALTVKNPRNFYWDTWGTWLSMLVTGLLPTWLVDKALHSLFQPK
eukprot:g3447.t1